jgi:PAS domain-containing protein
MTPHLSLSQLTFLVGVVLATAAVIILISYFFHRAIRQGPGGAGPTEAPLLIQDDTSFALAAMQGVISSLNQGRKRTQESLQATQQRAEETLRKLEVIAQEMEQGLLVFDRQGFISLANPAARSLLLVDTWSRRRYPEILGPESRLAGLIAACLGAGTATKNEMIEHPTSSGERRALTVSVIPLQDRNGTVEGVVCLVRERANASG